MLRVVIRRLFILKRASERSMIGLALEGEAGWWWSRTSSSAWELLPPSRGREADRRGSPCGTRLEEQAAFQTPNVCWWNKGQCGSLHCEAHALMLRGAFAAPPLHSAPLLGSGVGFFQEVPGLCACCSSVVPCAHLHHCASGLGVNGLFKCLSPTQTLHSQGSDLQREFCGTQLRAKQPGVAWCL